ncbi:MAG: Ig-like domain-containing protein, partial [Alphaproteobacteria bacterium]|nr:Ig-like domain-containing protein [Alphaproteobacteria bacterium]
MVRALDARALAVGEALALRLSEAFRSRDGGGLSYAAESSDPAVARASVDGGTLTVRGLAEGEAEVRVTATDGAGRSTTQGFAVMVTAPVAVWYLPPASDPHLQGFARVVNRSGRAGEVAVTATDDAGVEHGPLTLSMAAHAAAHLNSRDLEDGNPAKGLTGATGSGTGGWRLSFESDALDVEALAHLRAADGFVTGMGATVPKGTDGALELPTFNPAGNWRQASRLRLVNPSEEEAKATVTGVDDAGGSPGEPVVLTLPAGTACEVDAPALESGRGLACGEPQAGLGDGTGKWRLAIQSDAPLVAMGLLSSPAGRLSNLSGVAAADADGTWHVPLFPPASDPQGRQGFVRVINRSGRNGTVRVAPFDDTDFHYEPLTLRLDAGEAVHFNADDLELGNRGKGLVGSTGPGTGTWRLELSSAFIDFEAHAYVRHRDGFLTAMQAAAPSMPAETPAAGRVHRIAVLNPGSNWRQVGVLRLANRGSRDAVATVTGADDRGVRPGGLVEVRVPAGAAVELTAAALESGESDAIASGALG